MLTTLDKTKALIVEQLGFDVDEITPASTFIEDLGADSLDRIHLMMACEEEFGIAIDDPEAEAVRTVQDLIALVDGKLAAQSQKGKAHV